VILLNRDVSKLPKDVQQIAADALSVYTREFAQPFAKSYVDADVLSHHIGARLRPDEVRTVLRTVVDHGGLPEASNAIRDIALDAAKSSLANELAPGAATRMDGSVLDSATLSRASEAFNRSLIRPVHVAAVTNKAVMELPPAEQQLAALGIKEWATTIGRELANNDNAARAIATQLTARADYFDVTAIMSSMKRSSIAQQNLSDIRYLARFDHDPILFSANLGDRLDAAEAGRTATESLLSDGYPHEFATDPAVIAATRTSLIGVDRSAPQPVNLVNAVERAGVSASPVTQVVLSNPEIGSLPRRARLTARDGVTAYLDSVVQPLGLNPRASANLYSYLAERVPRGWVDRLSQVMERAGSKQEGRDAIGSLARVEQDTYTSVANRVDQVGHILGIRPAGLTDASLWSFIQRDRPQAISAVATYSEEAARVFAQDGPTSHALAGHIASNLSEFDVKRILTRASEMPDVNSALVSVRHMSRVDTGRFLLERGSGAKN
jgi:hypothetical protein